MNDQLPSATSAAPIASASGGFRDAWSRRSLWQQTAAVASLILTLVTGTLAGIQGFGATANDGGAAASTSSGASTSVDPSDLAPGLATGLWEGPLPPLPDQDDDSAAGSAESADEDGSDADEESLQSEWSPALFKMGFSFFMGFSIAFALRSFVKISLVAIGMMGLLLFGLEYMGLVTVEWNAMADRWDGIVAWLRPQVTSFHGFIAGQLPSAAAATGGLLAGWRRG